MERLLLISLCCRDYYFVCIHDLVYDMCVHRIICTDTYESL